MARILTVPEAEQLSRARELLRDIEQRVSRPGWPEENLWQAGRAAEAVDRAEDAVFNALNILGNYTGCEVAEAYTLARSDEDRENARRSLVEKERETRAAQGLENIKESWGVTDGESA